MAYERKRHLKDLFDQLLRFNPILGLFGHRQVGKTTFLSAEISNYQTLDDIETLELAQNNPKKFIAASTNLPAVIDECQHEPKLFPTLKERVRTNKKPGQFVLSGSVRFTSRLAIRESLAGRIGLLEMLPLTVTELIHEPLSDVMTQLFYHKVFSADSLRQLHPSSKTKEFHKHFQTYLQNGGLPGLCFVRSPQLQKNALNDLHELILARDMKTVSSVKTSVPTLKKLLAHIAGSGIEPYVASEVTRATGLAAPTQKSILAAFEAMFLIRRFPISGSKRECIVLEDQLEERLYGGAKIPANKILETAVYRNIRTQFMYRLAKGSQFETYLTRDHARVPIVIREQDHILGVIVHQDTTPSLSEKRSAASFLKNHMNAKVLFLSEKLITPAVIDERNLICSIASVL